MATEPNPQPKKSAEWEQTLVASEPEPEPAPPPAPAAPAPEPELDVLEPLVQETAPPPAPLEPLVASSAEPEPVEEPSEDIPSEWRAYVKREGSAYVLKEPYLDRDTRARLEAAFTKVRGSRLVERRWLPSKRQPVHEIERQVDGLEYKSRYAPKSISHLRASSAQARRALRGLERIPANILSKRVVYETEGGFVVEITYRELGQARKKFFTVPAQGTRAALAAVQSGHYAQATAVSDELIDAVHAGRARARPKVGPGKVLTWPIRNRHRPESLGLTARQARTLAQLGIHSTDQLRLRSPVVVARHLGVPADEARRLHSTAELLLVKGMQERYARVLAEAGIRGIEGLRRASPSVIAERANAQIKARRGKKLPGVSRARASQWARAAKSLRKTKQSFPA